MATLELPEIILTCTDCHHDGTRHYYASAWESHGGEATNIAMGEVFPTQSEAFADLHRCLCRFYRKPADTTFITRFGKLTQQGLRSCWREMVQS